MRRRDLFIASIPASFLAWKPCDATARRLQSRGYRLLMSPVSSRRPLYRWSTFEPSISLLLRRTQNAVRSHSPCDRNAAGQQARGRGLACSGAGSAAMRRGRGAATTGLQDKSVALIWRYVARLVDVSQRMTSNPAVASSRFARNPATLGAGVDRAVGSAASREQFLEQAFRAALRLPLLG